MRGGKVSGGHTRGAAGRPISTATGEAAIHTESRWEAAAIGDPDGTRPGGADGGEVGDRADLRGGLPAVQLWISSEEECDTGSGSNPRSGQPGYELCRGCRHPRLLRQHPEGDPDGAGEGADLGSKGIEVNTPMAGSGRDGGRD